MNPNTNNEPEYDIDGTRYHREPTEQVQVEYETFQRQSAEWANEGRCMGCGAIPPLFAGYCPKCWSPPTPEPDRVYDDHVDRMPED